MNDLVQTLCTEMRRGAASSVSGSGRPVGAQEVLVVVNQGLRHLRRLHPWLLSCRPVGATGGKCHGVFVIARAGWAWYGKCREFSVIARGVV